MNNVDAKLLVKKVFDRIKSAKSVSDFDNIVDDDPILQKNKFNSSKYPNLKINISTNDITKLKKLNILSDENKILPLTDSLDLSPLEKLLYSVLWKNGDLGKEKHIVEGVLASEDDDNSSKERGLVFYQYGKHLAKREEPIVDQHTIRAFLLFKNIESEDSEITKIRKKDTLKNDELLNFITWIKSSEIGGIDNQFHIDKVLFSLGKAVKITKRSEGVT
ncbi:MAG: hypothetical protein ACJAS1_000293 [Oleiphilaceae bacterium]|jgi:hypothetical protein